MKKYYDEISEGYNELYGDEQLAKWESARKLIKFSEGNKVLDVGCGTGLITEKIAKLVNFVVGLDYSEGMISHAIKKENIQYVVADAKHIPFNDKDFDKVVSFTMIQDVDNWDEVFKEMCRVSKGDVLITVLKRSKKQAEVERKLSKFFKIGKSVEGEKDFIFLLTPK
jgi:ubiquinone/menaquinone biosynthesis C-methylase UbiE